MARAHPKPYNETMRADELPELASTADFEEVSVTGVNGTVARFDMVYSPRTGARHAFGAPWTTHVFAYVFALAALALGAIIATAHLTLIDSSWQRWIVEGDRNRPLGSLPFALVIALSALGTVARSHLRGVIVTDDGIETRELIGFGIPRIRKLAWSQVHRVVIDDTNEQGSRHEIMLELWDGQYLHLPRLRAPGEACLAIEQQAAHFRISVTRLSRK